MKVAALADLHLGANLPGRRQGGRPVRQVDAERALEAAGRAIVERRPDLVTIAGDTFDSVAPPLAAVRAFMRFLRYVTTRTEAYVAIVGGNHETPRTAGVLSANELAHQFADRASLLGPGEVWRTPAAYVHGYGCSYLDHPDVCMPTPEPGAPNVLVIHGRVRSSARPNAVPPAYSGPEAYDVAHAEGFDVVACGDFHEFRVLAGAEADAGPVAFYSGSLERTSTGMWSEHAPKGFAFVDTEARTLEFVEVPTRAMHDYGLGPDACGGDLTAEVVNMQLDWMLHAPDAIAPDALVRLKVEGFPRSEKDGIDWSLVHALHRRCVHFRFDLRFAALEQAEFVDRRQRGAHSVADDAGLFFKDDEPPVRAACLSALGM